MKEPGLGRLFAISGALAAVTIILTPAGGARAECRPYVFGMGHYLAKWADQPWSYDEQAMDKMVEMGATALWVDFPWAAMEQTEGTIDFSYADHQVDAAEARGLEMFAFVGTTPDWAKLYPNLPAHRTPPSENHVTQFHDFHAALAARYAGRVTYYQFWNEPSGCGWINDGCHNGDDCSLFTLWQRRCYDALKAGNPGCLVSTGGFDGDPAGYVQCMYNELAGQTAFDAVSIHPYAYGGTGGPGTGGEGIDYSDLTQVRGVMVNNGDAHKKIWITEYGWSTTDENRKADDLVEVLTELKKPEYDYLFFAKYLVLNDWTSFCCFGLTDPWFNPRAGFYAFRDFDKTFPDEVDFLADVTRGPAPLTVQFTDTSCVNGACSWLWEFGDNQTSPDQHPWHTYPNDGIYTVRLTVTGDNGSFTEEKPDYIRVGLVTEIVNPSYEDPFGFLNGWSSCLAGESSIKHNPGTHPPDPRFHDGDNSAGMSSDRPGDSLGAGAIFQEVPVTPGRPYRVRCWGTLTDDTGYTDDLMELRIRDGDSTPINCLNNGANIVNNSDLYAHLDGQPATGWIPLQGDVTPTQNVITVIAYWEFSGSDWGIKSLHLDDWSIEEITPPMLVSAASRKAHGPAGDLDVDLPLAPPSAAGVECRTGGPTEVILTFSEPVVAADGVPDETEVNLSTGTLDAVSIDGNEMTIELSDVPDAMCLAITITGIIDLDGHLLSGDNNVHIRSLLADVNEDGEADLIDMAQVKSRNGEPLDAATARFDLNLDSHLDLIDMALAKSRNGNSVSCP